jgi:Est1 DNA/RNA binding domain/Telomerase activating protein Est1
VYGALWLTNTRYQSACETFLLGHFAAAVAKNTEIRLWNAHSKINNKYRSRLAKFRDANGKKRPVERRKLEKHYLNFIKSSMRFYRGYIQRLASHFKCPAEVLEVAQKLRLDSKLLTEVDDVVNCAALSADTPVEPSLQEAQLLLDSCHATLVRLGDLSRYRETELQSKNRNWAPAVGYYELATTIKPSSGASHNQLAVIALADGSHLRVLYHLYRALGVEEPYPRARENLETEFKKILDRKSKNQLFPQQPEQQPAGVLQAWFVYLHARLNDGVAFPEHEELENEVLTNLSVELKERSLEALLPRFVLINIAAQHLANTRAAGKRVLRSPFHGLISSLESSQDAVCVQAFVFLFRFNIKTFFTLLQVLLPELEQIASAEDDMYNGLSGKDTSDRITVTTRRILPCLRHYSSWLISNASYLVALENHESVGVQIAEFWRIYANALTLLAASFPRSDIRDVEYLLEEDEDTIAFTPFSNAATAHRYRVVGGVTLRPRIGHRSAQRRHHVNLEMLYRVKGLLEDGIALATAQVSFWLRLPTRPS